MASYKCAKKSHKQVCSAAEEIEGSDDLVTKILLFLPAKPLFRFKLVSKRWRSLISDPYVSSIWSPKTALSTLILQLLPSSSNPYCISFKDESIYEISHGVLDFVKDEFYDTVEVLSSCSGLLVCLRVKGRLFTSCIREFIVCNPITKIFTVLPNPIMTNTSLDMCLAFDHLISPHFKVVNVGLLCIEIYTSETNSWRQTRARFPKPYQSAQVSGQGVYFNGAIFWTLIWFGGLYYFDIDTEVLHIHPMPKMDRQHYFGCVNGNLHLVGSNDSEWPQLDIFELGNDYSSWTLKYCIDLHGVEGVQQVINTTRHLFSLEFSVLSVVAREGNQEPYLAICVPCQVILISFKDKYCRNLCKLPLYASTEVLHSFNCLRKAYHLIENPFWKGSSIDL